MLDKETAQVYHELRRMYPTYPAGLTLRSARQEIALRKAEAEDRIRFTREYDPDPMDPGEWGWPEREVEKYRQDMRDGRITVYVVTAEVREEIKCPHCGHVISEEWVDKASVGNVDVYDDADGEAYLRETERNLAMEAGVI